jgi:integral membrane sensor domain MASE1
MILGRSFHSLTYFTVWGLLLGIFLGALTGTLIYPVFGTMYATLWGAGIGLGMGILAGVVMLVATLFLPRPKMNWQRYRRRVTAGIGTLVAIGSGITLVATTRGVLWGPYTDGYFPYFLPSLLGAIFWGGLASTYTASLLVSWLRVSYGQSLYALDDADTTLGQIRRQDRQDMWFIIRHSVRQKWIYIAAIVLGLISVILLYGDQNISVGTIGFIIMLPVATFIATALYGLAVSNITIYLNRIVFAEYFPDMSKQRYKRIMQSLAVSYTVIQALAFLGGYWIMGILLLNLSYSIFLQAFIAILVLSIVMIRTMGAFADDYYSDLAEAQNAKKTGDAKGKQDLLSEVEYRDESFLDADDEADNGDEPTSISALMERHRKE